MLNWTAKHPIPFRRELSCLFPYTQHLQHFCIYGHRASGIDGFHFINMLTNYSSFNAELGIQPVHVRPLQSEAFTDPQTKANTAPDLPAWLSLSPDGNRIRLTVSNLNNNTSAIWEIRPDGSGMHPVFPDWNNPSAECCGKWTPDGKYYVFQSTRDGATNIWIVPDHTNWWRKDPREPAQLTTGPLQFSFPLPSKDGRKLFVIGTQPRAELVRYDAKADDFVPYLGGISAGDVDFSRDGQWVTYVSYPEDTLWRSKLDGSARLQLTYPPMRTGLAH
jgi:WD40 repeat protein